jgi:hypothetical protein
MNRERSKKLLSVIQAYAEGKDVQYYGYRVGRWCGCEEPNFESGSEWRIKPEPKYRPFKDAEECWNEMQKHEPFGWVMDKEGEYIFIIHLTGIGVCGGDDLEGFCYGSAVNVYQFTDGTPFGIKEGGEECLS